MTRRSLTKRQRLDCFEAAGGICHICRLPIDPLKERWEAEHIIPRALKGADTYPNLKPAHKRCHAEKTKADVPAIAKAVSVAERHLGIVRPKQRIRSTGFPPTGKTKPEKLPMPDRRPMFTTSNGDRT